MTEFPRVTFGIIVLNGEPFIRYCLRTIYPFAHEIIVVEGACKTAASIATSDGHSIDGTLGDLYRFKAQEDVENKVQIIVRDGFWSEKDEQSQAYAQQASGDYLWQVDVDEFYHSDDIRAVLMMLASDSSISGVSFHWVNFWGGFDYTVDGWEYRNIIKRMGGIRRVFRWGKGYRYVSHRPPTVVDEQGRNLCALSWIGPNGTAKNGIFCYHYGMVFPEQAVQKTLYYQSTLPRCMNMDSWYRESYLKLCHPFKILHGTNPPSWLRRFNGTHPEEIRGLIEDCKRGLPQAVKRRTDDIERLLSSRVYRATTVLLDYLYFLVMPALGLVLWSLRACNKLFIQKPVKISREVLSGFGVLLLEYFADAPQMFRLYRALHKNPDLERRPGGWFYKGRFYPDYLTVGGASHAVFREALKYCRGDGIDVGAGFWPLPGATPVDLRQGHGSGRKVADFEDASLDYVFSSHCLEHIENWQEALDAWVEKLKPGGIIFLYLPHPSCAIWHPGSPFVGEGHKWVPTPEVISRTLEEFGCKILQFDEGPDAMQSFYVCGRKQVRFNL